MTPVTPVIPGAKYKEVVFAKDQPEYAPLPAIRDSGQEGVVTTRWHLSWRERLQVLLHGNLWLQLLTFHQPLQPVALTTKRPDCE